MQILSTLAGIFGTIVGVVAMSILGLISIFNSEYSDELLDNITNYLSTTEKLNIRESCKKCNILFIQCCTKRVCVRDTIDGKPNKSSIPVTHMYAV